MRQKCLSKLRRIGRTFLEDDILWCGLSGTGVEFACRAQNVKICFVGDSSTHGQQTEGLARAAVYVDEERVADFCMEEPEKEIFLAQLCPDFGKDEHVVRVIKLSECPMSMIGIRSVEAECGELYPTAVKNLKIEFIGDSITCGYGVDMEDPLVPFSTETEDATKAYACQTAKLLGAEYSLVSFSGYGIITGYTDNDEMHLDQLVPLYYEKCGFSYARTLSGSAPQDREWDFADYVPEVIVINLGTNDNSYCKEIPERHELYKNAYAEFLKQVRSHNPKAKILCVLGLMEAKNVQTMLSAVECYRNLTGDCAVWGMELPLQQPGDGLVSDYHPTRKSHAKAAELVAAKIREILA